MRPDFLSNCPLGKTLQLDWTLLPAARTCECLLCAEGPPTQTGHHQNHSLCVALIAHALAKLDAPDAKELTSCFEERVLRCREGRTKLKVAVRTLSTVVFLKILKSRNQRLPSHCVADFLLLDLLSYEHLRETVDVLVNGESRFYCPADPEDRGTVYGSFWISCLLDLNDLYFALCPEAPNTPGDRNQYYFYFFKYRMMGMIFLSFIAEAETPCEPSRLEGKRRILELIFASPRAAYLLPWIYAYSLRLTPHGNSSQHFPRKTDQLVALLRGNELLAEFFQLNAGPEKTSSMEEEFRKDLSSYFPETSTQDSLLFRRFLVLCKSLRQTRHLANLYQLLTSCFASLVLNTEANFRDNDVIAGLNDPFPRSSLTVEPAVKKLISLIIYYDLENTDSEELRDRFHAHSPATGCGKYSEWIVEELLLSTLNYVTDVRMSYVFFQPVFVDALMGPVYESVVSSDSEWLALIAGFRPLRASEQPSHSLGPNLQDFRDRLVQRITQVAALYMRTLNSANLSETSLLCVTAARLRILFTVNEMIRSRFVSEQLIRALAPLSYKSAHSLSVASSSIRSRSNAGMFCSRVLLKFLAVLMSQDKPAETPNSSLESQALLEPMLLEDLNFDWKPYAHWVYATVHHIDHASKGPDFSWYLEQLSLLIAKTLKCVKTSRPDQTDSSEETHAKASCVSEDKALCSKGKSSFASESSRITEPKTANKAYKYTASSALSKAKHPTTTSSRSSSGPAGSQLLDVPEQGQECSFMNIISQPEPELLTSLMPNSLRTCLERLMGPMPVETTMSSFDSSHVNFVPEFQPREEAPVEKYWRIRRTLLAIPVLCNTDSEGSIIAGELALVLLGLRNDFDMEDFTRLQGSCLSVLMARWPLNCLGVCADRIFDPAISVTARLLLLNSLTVSISVSADGALAHGNRTKEKGRNNFFLPLSGKFIKCLTAAFGKFYRDNLFNESAERFAQTLGENAPVLNDFLRVLAVALESIENSCTDIRTIIIEIMRVPVLFLGVCDELLTETSLFLIWKCIALSDSWDSLLSLLASRTFWLVHKVKEIRLTHKDASILKLSNMILERVAFLSGDTLDMQSP